FFLSIVRPLRRTTLFPTRRSSDLSLSGLKNTTAHGTVYIDCGQGIEDGYGAGTGGPTGRVDTCLFVTCQSGVRHGDNYPSIGNGDRKSTRLNSSHVSISYAVFCLK